jgi:hypothetical protein
MEKEPLSSGPPDARATPPVEELAQDLEATHEITQRGHQLLEVSRELTSSSKALLEEIEPVV